MNKFLENLNIQKRAEVQLVMNISKHKLRQEKIDGRFSNANLLK